MIKIINLYWIRSNLHIVFDQEVDDQFLLVCKDKDIPVICDGNEVIFNITNTPEGHFLDEGVYRFLFKYYDLVIDNDLISRLDEFSKIFYYGGGDYTYLVSFLLDDEFHLSMKTTFMMHNDKPRKFNRLCQAKGLKRKIMMIIGRVGVLFFNLYYRFISLFQKKNSILFLSENDNEIKWNLKYMYDYVSKKDYKVRVFAENKYSSKKSVLSFLKEVTYIGLSDVIFVDNYVPLLTHLNLKKDVKFIQLWHAGIGFKSLGYARFGLPGSPHPYLSCHRKYTNGYVDQESLDDIYKEVFGVSKSIFKAYGMPRLDGYLNHDHIQEVLDRLGKINDKLIQSKVILFSPTYRGTGAATAYYPFSDIPLDKIYEFCKKNDFIFVIKMHPFIKKHIEIDSKYSDVIYDYSDMDINDLIYVSDIMITDYSSCAYEFSFFSRPLIFYRFDKEIYEYERPVHSVDLFSKEQFEVRSFDEVLSIMSELKDKVSMNRYAHFTREDIQDSCQKIFDDVMEGRD